MVKSAYNHVKNAYDSTPNDDSIKKFYDEVKEKYDSILNLEKSPKEEDGPAQKTEASKSTKEKLLSRVKIENNEEKLPPLGKILPEEETKERPKPQQPQ